MSVFETVAGWFNGAVNGVTDLAKRAWGAIHTVFHVFGQLALLLSAAWNWLVNGVEWLGSQAAELADAASAAIWHILTKVIPEAAYWALRRAVNWARTLVGRVEHWVKGLVATVIGWVKREINKLTGWAERAVHLLTHDFREAWDWIVNRGRKLWDIVMHPERLVTWILGHLVMPLLLFFLRSSASIMVLFLRSFRQRANEFMHTVEDILHELL